jgi:gas vesicle protein
MRSNYDTHDTGLTYLFVGVGLGLLAGLLWAPRRGEEMREELRRGADSGLDYLTDEAEKIRAEADRWLSRIKERWSQFRKPVADDGRFAPTSE